jgi:hypothetical protein
MSTDAHPISVAQSLPKSYTEFWHRQAERKGADSSETLNEPLVTMPRATLHATPTGAQNHQASAPPNSLPERVHTTAEDLSTPHRQAKQFIIGVDYGTTFTSVSYLVRPAGDTHHIILAEDIKTIKNWPDDPALGAAEQVPTESWYPSIPMERPAIEDQFDTPDEIDSQRHQDGVPLPWSVGKAEAVFTQEDIDARGFDSDKSREFLWGYAVSYQRYAARTTRNPMRLIQHAKLLLVKTTHMKDEREEIRCRLNHLLNQKIIRKYGSRSEPDVRDVRVSSRLLGALVQLPVEYACGNAS